jgi:hypothetical protein
MSVTAATLNHPFFEFSEPESCFDEASFGTNYSTEQASENSLGRILEYCRQSNFLNLLSRPMEIMSDKDHPTRKRILSSSNMATMLSQLISLNRSFEGESTQKGWRSLIANLSYRSTVFLNGFANALIGLSKNDFFYALGNSFDMLAAFFPKVEQIYTVRGLSVGTYNAATSIKNGSAQGLVNGSYESIGHSVQEFATGIKNFFKDMLTDPREFFKQVMSPEKSHIGLAGGIFTFVGGLSALLGFDKLSKLFRHILGGSFVDLERFHIKNLVQGKGFQWLSGVFFSIGTVADLVGLHKLNIICDNTARLFSMKAYDAKEVSSDYRGKPISIPWKDFGGFVGDISGYIKEFVGDLAGIPRGVTKIA